MKRFACKKCGRFLAEITTENSLSVVGKSVHSDNYVYIKCPKCSNMLEILIDNNKKIKYNCK